MNELIYQSEGAGGIKELSAEGKLLTERRVFLNGEITDGTLDRIMKSLMYLADSDEPVRLYINSTGGSVNAGLAILDILHGCPFPVDMICVGQACSMAAVILASGGKGRRFILPHSRVMIHEVLLAGGVGGSATSISRISESVMETRDLINGILAEHTGRTVEEINKATSFDNMMNAKQAVEFGICDKIIKTPF